MEEEKKEPEKRRSAPGTGEQYLIALIKCAEWVPRSYKQLAEKNKANPEILKELYLCACDGIPVEKAMEAMEKNPPEGALRFLRHKHIVNLSQGDYVAELTDIKETTSTLERDVKQMYEVLNHIADHVPNFDGMFPEDGQEQQLSHENQPKAATSQEEAAEHIPITKNVPKSGTQKIRKMIQLPWIKKKGISDFIEKLINDGYSTEQIDYLLDCIEDGMELDSIKKIASPKLPVDVMKRLRILEERKENKNGK